MTETKNFALKLPEPTDMVDIEVLNENFRKIDEEMGPYKLDLYDSVTYDESSRTRSFVIRDDGTEVAEVMAAKRPILLRVKLVEWSFALIDWVLVESEANIMLDSYREDENDNVVYGILLPKKNDLHGMRRSVKLWKAGDALRLDFEYDLSDSDYELVTLFDEAVLSFEASASQQFEATMNELGLLQHFIRTVVDTGKIPQLTTADGRRIKLPDKEQVSDTVVRYSGISTYAEDASILHKAVLEVDTTTGATVFHWNAIQGGGGSGSVSEIPTNTKIVKSDSTVTITTTLEGDKQSVTTITVDENDYPTKINVDGTEWPVTWEGF